MTSRLAPWQSIRTRATAFTLLVFVLGIWAMSAYVSSGLRASMERLLGKQQFSVATAMAQQVDREMTNRMQALRIIAKEMDADLLRSPPAVQARLEQRPLLQLLFNGGVWVTGLDGTAMAGVPRSANRVGVNFMDRDYMLAALKEGKEAIGQPVMGKRLKAPAFAMAVPVRDAQGKVIGALVGATNLGQHNFLDNLRLNPYGKTGGYLLIHPQSRQIVTATDPKRIMEVLPATEINRYVDRNIAGYVGYGVLVNALGEEQLASVKQLPAWGWYIVLGLPTAEAFAPMQARQQHLLWATLLLTLITGPLIWWVLRRQLAPLAATSEAMVALADAKQIPAPLPERQPGEIGHLVAAFNQIVQTWKQREAALTDSQQNLAITLNSIGDAVIATDATGLITRMNPVAERLTGWSLADAIGQPLTAVFRIISAETRLPAVNPVQLVMDRGEVVGLANHTALLARGGQEYQIADIAAPIRDATNTIVGVVLVFSDVTEKYRVEESLRASEQRFRAILEAAPVPMAVNDLAENITYLNAAFTATFGYTLADITTLADWWPKAYPDPVYRQQVAERWMAELGRSAQTRTAFAPMEITIRCKDGTERIALTSATPLEDAFAGTHLVVLHDITERKQAEMALKASNAQLQLLETCVSRLNDIVLITEAEPFSEPGPRIVFVNDAFVRRTGFSREEVIGKSPRMLQGPKTDRKELDRIRAAMERWEPVRAELLNYSKSGQEFWIELDIVPVADATGWFTHWVAVERDVTERKQIQMDLQISLQEKTALLLEVHHRVKNNLQVITSLLRLESFRSTDAPTKSVLQDMQGRVRAMALLHETIYRKGSFAAIDLGSYAGQIAGESLKSMQVNPGAVRLQLDMETLQVGLDQATPAGMLISELISNSLKHAFPEGRTGEICISLHPLDTSGQWRLRVSDSGIGLPPDFEERRKASLGLQLAVDLATQMGGTLHIGAGPQAVFTVDFKAEVQAPLKIILNGVKQ